MILKHPKLPNWNPPGDYQPVDSALEGITVFAPRPEAPKEEDAATTYVCPNCGASTGYDVAAGGVACEYCGYTAAAAAEVVGKRAEKFEFTLNTMRKVEQGWGVSRQQLHCDNCGADLALPEGMLTTTCPFCASNKVNMQTVDDDRLRPRFMIPFKIEKAVLSQKVEEWLGKGWYHPGDLSKSVDVTKFTGIYFPFWTFSARLNSTWKAEIGYDETERYFSDGEWKTRTVTRWRWENGQVNLPINNLLVPGTSHASHVLIRRLYPYNLNELATYSPDYLAGWQAQAYDISLTDAWETGKNLMRDKAKSACYSDNNGDHIRNFSMTADFEEESWRYILLPVYLSSYKFEDKVYQVMVNGQTGKVEGQKPVAWWKVWLVIALMFSPGVTLGLIGLPLLLAGGIGMVPIILGFILLIPAAIGSFMLYRKATQSEAI